MVLAESTLRNKKGLAAGETGQMPFSILLSIHSFRFPGVLGWKCNISLTLTSSVGLQLVIIEENSGALQLPLCSSPQVLVVAVTGVFHDYFSQIVESRYDKVL